MNELKDGLTSEQLHGDIGKIIEQNIQTIQENIVKIRLKYGKLNVVLKNQSAEARKKYLRYILATKLPDIRGIQDGTYDKKIIQWQLALQAIGYGGAIVNGELDSNIHKMIQEVIDTYPKVLDDAQNTTSSTQKSDNKEASLSPETGNIIAIYTLSSYTALGYQADILAL